MGSRGGCNAERKRLRQYFQASPQPTSRPMKSRTVKRQISVPKIDQTPRTTTARHSDRRRTPTESGLDQLLSVSVDLRNRSQNLRTLGDRSEQSPPRLTEDLLRVRRARPSYLEQVLALPGYRGEGKLFPADSRTRNEFDSPVDSVPAQLLPALPCRG